MSNVIKIDVPTDREEVASALEEADNKNPTADLFHDSTVEFDEDTYASDPNYYDDVQNVLKEWSGRLGNDPVWGGYIEKVNGILGLPRPEAAAPATPAETPASPPQPPRSGGCAGSAPVTAQKTGLSPSPFVLKMVFPLGPKTADAVEGFDLAAGDLFFEKTTVDTQIMGNLSIDIGLFFVDKTYNEQCRQFAKAVFDYVNEKVPGAADDPALIADTNQRNFFMTAMALKDLDKDSIPAEAELTLVFPLGPKTSEAVDQIDGAAGDRFFKKPKGNQPAVLTVDLAQFVSDPLYNMLFRGFASEVFKLIEGKVPGAAEDPGKIADTNQRNFFTTVSALKGFNIPAAEALSDIKINPGGADESKLVFQYDRDEWTNDEASLTVERGEDGMVLTLDLEPYHTEWLGIYGVFTSNPIEEEWERGTWKIYLADNGELDAVTFQTEEEIWDDTTRVVMTTGYSVPSRQGTFEKYPEVPVDSSIEFVDDSGLYTIDDPARPPFQKSAPEIYRRLGEILERSPLMTDVVPKNSYKAVHVNNNQILLENVISNLEQLAKRAEAGGADEAAGAEAAAIQPPTTDTSLQERPREDGKKSTRGVRQPPDNSQIGDKRMEEALPADGRPSTPSGTPPSASDMSVTISDVAVRAPNRSTIQLGETPSGFKITRVKGRMKTVKRGDGVEVVAFTDEAGFNEHGKSERDKALSSLGQTAMDKFDELAATTSLKVQVSFKYTVKAKDYLPNGQMGKGQDFGIGIKVVQGGSSPEATTWLIDQLTSLLQKEIPLAPWPIKDIDTSGTSQAVFGTNSYSVTGSFELSR